MIYRKVISIFAFASLLSLPAQSQVVTAFAGNNTNTGYAGDHGPATAAACALNNPKSICHDASGNFYFLDAENYVVRKISSSGIITTIAGTGTANTVGTNPSGVPATSVDLDLLLGIAVDASGNVYFGEGATIRKVTTSGNYLIFAGTGVSGFTGNGGQATAATIDPVSLEFDAAGNLYFSEYYNNAIRKINSSGIVSIYAGQGPGIGGGYSGDGAQATNAKISGPRDAQFDAAGNMYVVDASNNVVRKISPAGIISTVAGNYLLGPGSGGDAGPATAAQLNSPMSVAIDAAGNFYIGDGMNQKIRRVKSNGIISTYVGNGSWIWNGNGLAGPSTTIWGVEGIDYYSGSLYFCESGNDVIRKIATPLPTGISPLKQNNDNFKVYPNPNNGAFTLTGIALATENSVDVSICDITGRIVLHQQPDVINGNINTSLNIPDTAPAGIYLLKISSGSGTEVLRFIKNN